MTPAAPLTLAGATAIALLVTVGSGAAHKPITSPYTFTEDVAPILREHCSSCHVSGIAPMALGTYEETVPWAESMRIELVAGHMPPWGLEGSASRFTNTKSLTARELNVLLTWAAGGTPPGTPTPVKPDTVTRSWPLGEPDLRLQPASEFTMAADVQDHVEEFTLDTGITETRWLRAVDVLPGDPTVVRSATVAVPSVPRSRFISLSQPETLLALRVPGDTPMALEGAGFLLPAGARLVLRVRYKKTWQRERDVVHDRSTVGLYFATTPVRNLEAVSLEPTPSELAARGHGTLQFSRLVEEDSTALAVYADPEVHGAGVDVRAVRPDGSREALIAFRPQHGWARRYWFRQPIALPAGTRIEVRLDTASESALLAPGAVRPAPMDITRARLTVNVLRGR